MLNDCEEIYENVSRVKFFEKERDILSKYALWKYWFDVLDKKLPVEILES